MTEMPPRIAALPRDGRGYPIPFIVMRDERGVPQFVVNDSLVVLDCVRRNLCHVCGQALESRVWFTGGAANALLNGDMGIYIDGPMHEECKDYAMAVCPHLSHQLDAAVKLAPIHRHLESQGITLHDNTVLPGVPMLFIAVRCERFKPRPSPRGMHFEVPKPFQRVEYWQSGARLNRDQGRAEVAKYRPEIEARLARALRDG